MRLLALALALAALLLAGCAQDPTLEAPMSDSPAQPDASEADADVLEGTLGGDAQLEGGCAWLDTGDERYELVYPDGYEVAFEPLRLRGPDRSTVAEEGVTIRVRGRVADDLMSTCQVGTLYEVSEVLTDS